MSGARQAAGFALEPAGWTREGNGTLVGGVENRVIGYWSNPVDSGTGAPNVRSPLPPCYEINPKPYITPRPALPICASAVHPPSSLARRVNPKP